MKSSSILKIFNILGRWTRYRSKAKAQGRTHPSTKVTVFKERYLRSCVHGFEGWEKRREVVTCEEVVGNGDEQAHVQSAMPVPSPSFEGPAGELRFSLTLLAELLLCRLTVAIGGGPLRPP